MKVNTLHKHNTDVQYSGKHKILWQQRIVLISDKQLKTLVGLVNSYKVSKSLNIVGERVLTSARATRACIIFLPLLGMHGKSEWNQLACRSSDYTTRTTAVSQSDCRIPNVPEKASSPPVQGTVYLLKWVRSALCDLWHWCVGLVADNMHHSGDSSYTPIVHSIIMC